MYIDYNEFDALDPIGKQIDITIINLNLPSKKIIEKNTEIIIQDVCKKYCFNNSKHYLWEGVCKAVNETGMECIAVFNNNAWMWVGEFINNSAILFFNPDDEKISYEFNNGKDIVDFLTECYSFEFYIVNKELEFLICYSHHRILYACGTAVNWLKKYKIKELNDLSK